MCGFLGQFNTSNLTRSDFLKLLAISQHRGPDQTGYWEGSRVQFGFNRLAILDLTEAGNQPMESFTGRFIVVFNGEIYNHKELRRKLAKSRYRGHSDTETITHALEEWGIQKTVQALDGMFAIAIYDNLTRSLTLARDFAGIKPLFYGIDNGGVVFASQYDQIVKHPIVKPEIDMRVLKLYLKQHFVPAPFGIYKNTFQLRPGEIKTFGRNGSIQELRYWEMPEYSSGDLITDPAKANQVYGDVLRDCVRDQLMSDVPLGAFLSGGVDSPLICNSAVAEKEDLEVFSIGSDSQIHDESERAKSFAESLNVKHHIWKLNASEMLNYWDEAVASLHEPLADFSILPTYLVSKLAKESATVSLSGDGGDELFFGYERFWSIAKNLKFHNYQPIIRNAIYGADKLFFRNAHVNSLVTISSQSKAHESLHSRFSNQWIEKIIPDLQGVKYPDEWDVYNYDNAKDLRSLMFKMRRAEFYGMMQKTLRKVDLASMQNSLEVRVPFLQKKSIEASLRIDPLLSVSGGTRKQVLKNLLIEQIPSVEDDGIKRGFSIPLGDWMRGDLQNQFDELAEDLQNQFDFINAKAVEEMMLGQKQGCNYKWPLFTLFALSKI